MTRAAPGPAPAAGPQPSPSVLRDRSFQIALLIAVVVALGFGLVVPVLPLFARDFGVGLFAVTGVVAVFAAVRLLSNPYTGALTDRIGGRRAVGWGAIIVAVSSLLAAGAPNYWALLTLRGLGGFGSALFFNALLTLVIRVVPSDQRGRAVGILQGAFLFGIAFGPTVGGLLAQPLGLRWPFVIYAGFCAGAGLIALRGLPRDEEVAGRHVDAARGADEEPVAAEEGRRPLGLAAMARAAVQLASHRAFLAAMIMMAASRWVTTGVRFSLVPVFGKEVVGASEFMIGVAVTLAAVTHLLLVWPAGKANDLLGRRAVAIPAYLAFAGISLLLATAGSVPAFLAVMALFGVGSALTSPGPPAIVADVVPKEQTGMGVGVLNAAGDLGSVLGPLVSGFLAQTAGYGWGFGASGVVLALGALAALLMRETLPGKAPASS
ncbi:MAG TPA: MFS transporter [Egibacteraceae bacterium]|nr:MFS transporter [Egibacteraceae bacterium]